MIKKLRNKTYNLLRQSEKWTKTDMIYLAKGGFWLSLGQIISAISAFLLAIAFANLLPKETYGIYKYILSIVGILMIPTLSGMQTAVTQAVAQGFEGSLIPALKTKIRWGLLSGLGSMILAIYYYINNNIDLTFSFLITAIFLPFIDAFNLYGSLLNGRKQFRLSAKYNVITQTLSISGIIGVLFFSDNIFLIIFAYFFLNTLLRFVFLKISINKLSLNKNRNPKTIPYGKHLSLMSVISTISGNLDKILLWHFLGASDVAIYAFARAPISQLSAFLKSIITLSFPKLAINSTEAIKKTLPKKMFKFFIIIATGVIIYNILATPFFKTFFPQYLDSVKYTRVWSLVLLFFPQKLIGATLQAKMQKKELYILSITNPIIQIIMLVILLPIYGIYGALIANLIPYAWNAILQFYFLKKMR